MNPLSDRSNVSLDRSMGRLNKSALSDSPSISMAGVGDADTSKDECWDCGALAFFLSLAVHSSRHYGPSAPPSAPTHPLTAVRGPLTLAVHTPTPTHYPHDTTTGCALRASLRPHSPAHYPPPPTLPTHTEFCNRTFATFSQCEYHERVTCVVSKTRQGQGSLDLSTHAITPIKRCRRTPMSGRSSGASSYSSNTEWECEFCGEIFETLGRANVHEDNCALNNKRSVGGVHTPIRHHTPAGKGNKGSKASKGAVAVAVQPTRARTSTSENLMQALDAGADVAAVPTAVSAAAPAIETYTLPDGTIFDVPVMPVQEEEEEEVVVVVEKAAEKEEEEQEESELSDDEDDEAPQNEGQLPDWATEGRNAGNTGDDEASDVEAEVSEDTVALLVTPAFAHDAGRPPLGPMDATQKEVDANDSSMLCAGMTCSVL